MPTFAIKCACNKNVTTWKQEADLRSEDERNLRISCHQHATSKAKRCWGGSDLDLWGHIIRLPIEVWPDLTMVFKDSVARGRSRSPRRDEPSHQPRYNGIVSRYQAKPRSPVRPPGTAQLPPRPSGSWEQSRLLHHNDDNVQGLQYLIQLTLESQSMMQQLMQQNQQLSEQLRRERYNDDRHHDDDRRYNEDGERRRDDDRHRDDDRRYIADGERHRDNDRHRHRGCWS